MTRVLTSLNIDFSDTQGQSSGRIQLKSELIQPFMNIIVSCKNEKGAIKNEGARMLAIFFPIISLWDFFQTLNSISSRLRGRIGPDFEHVLDLMVVLLTYKNEENAIKNESA